jgi:hypothetical protein
VAASNLAPDTWWKDTTVDLWRQHNDGGTLTHDGSFYSLKVSSSTVWEYLAMYGGTPTAAALPEHVQRFAGRTVTIGAWIKASDASFIRPLIQDGSDHVGSYHTGGGAWEWIEYTYTVSATATHFRAGWEGRAAAKTAYISQPMLVFGSAIGSGNYSRPSGEIVWFESRAFSNKYHAKTGANGWSSQAIALLNLEADSNGKIPKGAKTVTATTLVSDSGSAATSSYLSAGQDSTMGYAQFQNTIGGIADGKWFGNEGVIPCDANGDIYTSILASGANTFDTDTFYYYGVQLR